MCYSVYGYFYFVINVKKCDILLHSTTIIAIVTVFPMLLNYFEALLSCGKLCQARQYVYRFSPELLFEGRKEGRKDRESVTTEYVSVLLIATRFNICEEPRSGN